MDSGNSKFQTVLKYIEQADTFEIDEIIMAITRRYQVSYPDDEIFFLSLPKNSPEERHQTLHNIQLFLEQNQ